MSKMAHSTYSASLLNVMINQTRTEDIPFGFVPDL